MILSSIQEKPIHFVGIGGIGMSGIAEVLLDLGCRVTGSDVQENSNIERLRQKGATVYIGHREEQVVEASVVVISSAVKSENQELIEARRRQIPVLKRAEMLAELMRLKRSICVSGTHGKTTTTSLCAALLTSAGMDPTVVNGGIINAYRTNAKLGEGDWFVAEADESDGSFLKLPPTISVVTNIDPEHLENYGSFDHVIECYNTFVHNIPFYGLAVLCSDHPVVAKLARRLTDRRKVTYGLEVGAEIQATNIRLSPEGAVFDVVFDPVSAFFQRPNPLKGSQEEEWAPLKDLRLSMVGKHNIQNALVLVALSIEMGISEHFLRQALSEFRGVKRRFTQVGIVSVGSASQVSVIDDYAHHPVEIAVVLDAARQCATGRVVAVFQPHRYTRLRDLFSEFASSLQKADAICVCPIYTAGESPIEGIDVDTFMDLLRRLSPQKSVVFTPSVEMLATHLRSTVQSQDMIVCLGAGSITQWAYQLPALLSAEA